jgi:hypothetical protein
MTGGNPNKVKAVSFNIRYGPAGDGENEATFHTSRLPTPGNQAMTR